MLVDLLLKQKKTMKKVVDVKTSWSFVLYKQQIDVDFYIVVDLYWNIYEIYKGIFGIW